MESLLREELPEIVNNGAFGKNLKYVSFELNKNQVGQDQYMSIVLFGTVTTSEESQYHVVIKLKLQDKKLRVKFKIDFQFHNEITMYKIILPFLFECRQSLKGVDNWPSLARLFYGRNKCGEFVERDLIILKNVIPLGFRLGEARPFLDYDHLVAALRALAKFHGLSYTAKHKNPDRLQKILTEIHELSFETDGKWFLKNDAFRRLCKRGVKRLLERNGDLYWDNEHLGRFNELSRDGDKTLRRLPVVLCGFLIHLNLCYI